MLHRTFRLDFSRHGSPEAWLCCPYAASYKVTNQRHRYGYLYSNIPSSPAPYKAAAPAPESTDQSSRESRRIRGRSTEYGLWVEKRRNKSVVVERSILILLGTNLISM